MATMNKAVVRAVTTGIAALLLGALVLSLSRQAPVEAELGDWLVTLTFERSQVSEPRLGAAAESAVFTFEAQGWNDWTTTLVTGSIGGLDLGWFERVDPTGRIVKGVGDRVEHVSQAEGRHLPGPYLSPAWRDRWEQDDPPSAVGTMTIDEAAGGQAAERLGLPRASVAAYRLTEPVTCAELGLDGCERDAGLLHEVAVHMPTGVPLRVVERYGDAVLSSYEVTAITVRRR